MKLLFSLLAIVFCQINATQNGLKQTCDDLESEAIKLKTTMKEFLKNVEGVIDTFLDATSHDNSTCVRLALAMKNELGLEFAVGQALLKEIFPDYYEDPFGKQCPHFPVVVKGSAKFYTLPLLKQLQDSFHMCVKEGTTRNSNLDEWLKLGYETVYEAIKKYEEQK